MRHQQLRCRLFGLVVVLGLWQAAAIARDFPVAGLGQYPQSASVAIEPGSQPWPPPLPPPTTKHGSVPTDPSMKPYPYGYFGAVPHYRMNSHYTSSGEYMFWRIKRH